MAAGKETIPPKGGLGAAAAPLGGGGTWVILGCTPCLHPPCHGMAWNERVNPVGHCGLGITLPPRAGGSLNGFAHKMARKVCPGHKGDLLALDERTGMLKFHCHCCIPPHTSGRESPSPCHSVPGQGVAHSTIMSWFHTSFSGEAVPIALLYSRCPAQGSAQSRASKPIGRPPKA